MDVSRLKNAIANRNMDVHRSRAGTAGQSQIKPARSRSSPEPDKTQIKQALDKIIKNTRFQYEIKDEIGYYIVRIIDKDTDKVIREIPSQALQRVHDDIQRVLGLLFDQEI